MTETSENTLKTGLSAAFGAANLPEVRLIEAETAARFELYFHELIRWNKTIKLTGIKSLNDFYHRHVLDSLFALPLLHQQGMERVLDIGSGAGFPGIPLAILLPEVHFTLTESHQRRAAFLRHVKTKLQLKNVSILSSWMAGKPEEEGIHGTFDCLTFRAVNPLKVLPYLASYLSSEGSCLYWTTPTTDYLEESELRIDKKLRYTLKTGEDFELHELSMKE